MVTRHVVYCTGRHDKVNDGQVSATKSGPESDVYVI